MNPLHIASLTWARNLRVLAHAAHVSESVPCCCSKVSGQGFQMSWLSLLQLSATTILCNTLLPKDCHTLQKWVIEHQSKWTSWPLEVNFSGSFTCFSKCLFHVRRVILWKLSEARWAIAGQRLPQGLQTSREAWFLSSGCFHVQRFHTRCADSLGPLLHLLESKLFENSFSNTPWVWCLVRHASFSQ